jgi:hypothetical protein
LIFIISIVHDLHNIDDHLENINNISIGINCLSTVTTDSPPPLSCLSISNNWYQSRFLLFKGRSVSLNMTSHEGTSTNKPPLFDGTNFSFWKVRMRTYIMALGVDVWDVVETGYTKPVVLASKDDKLEFSFNAKAMNVILSGLAEAEFVKVMHLESAKEMWDKLISSYEGNEKVKDAKLQTYRLKFEQLNMNEDETINKYFLRVEELVNSMKGLGEKIEDTFLVQKILRSLPNRFNPKVSAIEELNDLKILSIDQLLGTLTAYEMRISKDKPTSREASFKAR